jgi:hypothetical protein
MTALAVRTPGSSQFQLVNAQSASNGSLGSGQSSNAETATSTAIVELGVLVEDRS